MTIIYLYATSKYPKLLLFDSSSVFIKYLETGFMIE